MLKIYVIGVAILVVAILANMIIVKLGLKSWYDFIELMQESGSGTFKKVSLIEYIWLFIGYPIVLGLGYLIGDEIYKLF